MAQGRPAALVTGSASGIGRAAALRLARAGYDVAINYRRSAGAAEQTLRDLEGCGGRHIAVQADVSDEPAVVAMVAAVGDAYGRLDALVNNAGISGELGPGSVQDPTTLDLDLVRTVVETNVIGVIRVTNAMLPLLRRSSSPRIVNISSSVGSVTRQADPDIEIGSVMAAYAPSKSFLNAVTVQYARQFADTNILINVACPGLVATDFTGFFGPRTPEQGAATAIRLATLPDDGPSGAFFEDEGVVPW